MRLLVIVVLLTCYFSLCSGGIESSIESGGSAVVGATTAHLRSRQNLWQNYSTAYEESVWGSGFEKSDKASEKRSETRGIRHEIETSSL